MNLEEARNLAREAYIISIDLAEDEDTVEAMRRTILELADKVEKLRERAEYWEAAHQTDMKIMTEQLHHAILKGG